MKRSSACSGPPHDAVSLRPRPPAAVGLLLSVRAPERLGHAPCEARHLQVDDVDLDAEVLTIRGAKFGKTRLVPLHPSTRTVLADYLARRHTHWPDARSRRNVFVSSRGNRLDVGDIHRTFYALARQIGLRGPSDHRGPRLHDLRHRVALRTLWRWYRAGEDPERRLPVLSAYLGHSRPRYLLVPQCVAALMQEAMTRLERRWEEQV